MPLSPPVRRTHRHTRRIEFFGYERDDGLWDVEGHITDTKTYAFHNRDRGEIRAGEPVHDMWIRLTLGEDLVVREAEAAIDAGPYILCGDIASAFASLKGLKVGPGWYARVKERVGGVKGCTHVVEMLGPMATAILQTLYPTLKEKQGDGLLGASASGGGRRPFQIDQCHAHASDSPVVRERWPDFYTGPGDVPERGEGRG